MKYTLDVSTAVWSPEDVAHGSNDPERTTTETVEFSDVGEVVMYLLDRDLVEASSYPVTGNEQRVYWAEKSRVMAPGEEVEDRLEVTASRGEGFPDDAWLQVVNDVIAAKRTWQDQLYVYATLSPDLPIAVGTHKVNGVNGSFALFADESAASLFVTAYAKDQGMKVSVLPSAALLGVEWLDQEPPAGKYVIKVDGVEMDHADDMGEALRNSATLIYGGLGTDKNTSIELRKKD